MAILQLAKEKLSKKKTVKVKKKPEKTRSGLCLHDHKKTKNLLAPCRVDLYGFFGF